MKDPRCPFCGWEVEPLADDDVAMCTHCKEWVVAEDAVDLDPEWEAAGDLSVAAEVELEFQKEFGADADEFDPEYREWEA